MDIQAVLFDFDYTLGDATDSIVAGFQYALTTLGWPAPDRESVRATIGYMLYDGYTMLTGDKDPEHIQRFLDLFAQRAKDMQIATTVLFPGAEALLQGLRATGYKLGVVSSKRSSSLEPVLERLAIRPLLDLVIGGDMVSAPKPDPEGLNRALELLNLPPQSMLFCGDTILDAGAAQRAGTHFCAVLNGVTPAEAFGPYPCDHIAPDLWDLKAWLGV